MHLYSKIRLTIGTKMLLGYFLVVILMGTFTIYAGLSFITTTVVKEAIVRVQMDLNSAWLAFNEEKALIQSSVMLAAQHDIMKAAINQNVEKEEIINRFNELRQKANLDFLTLINRQGIVVGGSSTTTSFGSRMRDDPIIRQALKGNVAKGSVLIPHTQLMLKNEELADRATINIIETERARPADKKIEDRGMALETAVPIFNMYNDIIGVLYGGILLNRKFELVDRIRDNIFQDEVYAGKPLGTVTIFLWDVRIATNVIKIDSTRAIGTRVSEEVYTKVLEHGERFGDRAFVVNDWYLSAYDPIKDPENKIIGILYVGLLEKKYLDYKSSLVTKFLGVGMVALLLSALLAFIFAGSIRRPILKLVEATRRISAGELSTRLKNVNGSLEITELANSFDSMAESLEIRSKQLEKATQEIKQAYHAADEKNRAYLEMLGFVTHELKSPLASIVFAIGSLREHLLGPLTESQEAVLKSSAKSADYLNTTIANFLNLSRIEEGELRLKLWKVSLRNTIIDPAMQRLAEMAADSKIKFYCNIPQNIEVTCDPNLITSVFQNLLSNAVKYGRENSRVDLCLEPEDNNNFVKISVYNEGIGFNPEDMKNLFTKFSRFSADRYDTKSGTGLGLFVTKKIINQHGGEIWASSEEGKWAKFTFTIPRRILSTDSKKKQ